ncbi:hypothetical protein bcere0010_2040 [Bacillus cereus ATCC 4342]|nr:hypothetical protein bcere0010_2040 [Bacillus cereus ATCC 4342]
MLQSFYYTNTLDRNTINAVNTTAPLADPTKSPFVTCNTCSFILCILLLISYLYVISKKCLFHSFYVDVTLNLIT